MSPFVRFLLSWTGCALLGAAPLWFFDYWIPPNFWVGGGIVLAAVLAIGIADASRISESRNVRRLATGFLFAVAVCLAAVGACMILEPTLVRQPRFAWFSELTVAILRLFREAAITPQADIALRSHEGALIFAPTADKAGLVPLTAYVAAGLTVLLRDRERVGSRSAALMLCVLLTSVTRGTFNILRFTALDNVLSEGGPAKTEIFQRPWETLAWLVGASFLMAAVCARPSGRTIEASPQGPSVPWLPDGRRRTLALINLVLGTALVAFAWQAYPSSVTKRGRILVDDTFSKYWIPSARRLTSAWFGDFSTYNLSSGVEWLGYHYAVTVNAGRAYSDALLEDYDVVILKIPVDDIPQEVYQSLLRFVRRGGGLFLIGDHTNLMGANARLNLISRQAGIEFRYDSVMSSATAGFTLYRRPLVGAHPAVRRVDRMQFMTSCSLGVAGRAEPVLVAHGQVRQNHDYANGSYFGSLYSDPSMDSGPLVLTAAGELGDGRILAFSDSTILSSFALFDYDREKFLLDAVAFLNRGRPSFAWMRYALLFLGGLCAVFGVSVFWRAPDLIRLATLEGGLVLGLAAGSLLAETFVERAYPVPRSVNSAPRISVWRGDTEGLFPPVLGSSGNLNLDSCYDTWAAAICRSGVFPSMVHTWDDALKEKALFVLNPSRGLQPGEQAKLRNWVKAGGILLLGTKTDHVHPEALQSYLTPLGLRLRAGAGFPTDSRSPSRLELEGAEKLELPSSSLSLFKATVGNGRILFVAGTQWWSRERLGHAFNLPSAAQRGCYRSLSALLEDHARLAPDHRRTYAILERSP